ncbi:MAG: hypothetical protein ABIQ55_10090 [Gemmatimonadaceae bacterium]
MNIRLAVSVSALVIATNVPAAAPARAQNAAACDASLWKRVYSPTRLKQVKPCISATGTIAESSADDDGDQHFLLKLDKGQADLLNKRNLKKKDGNLVVEIVCANPVMLKKVKKTCSGYSNPIPIPAVGSHVRVTGAYVIDGHNGWAEIHPVSRMDLIK